MNKVNTISLSFAATILLGFLGCDSSSNSTTFTSTTSNIYGKVLDGYLDKATVCLDKNLNTQCDSTEPTTTSINGAYTLLVTDSDKNLYPILVEAKAGVTIDLDLPNSPITESYTLTSTIDKPDVISPLTTLVKAEIDKNPTLSTEEASKVVTDTLNLANDATALFEDYVIKNDSDEIYTQLHEVAKAVVQFQIKTSEKLKNDLNLDTLLSDSQKEAFNALINEITIKNIEDISNEIKNNGETASNLDTEISNLVDNTDVDIDDYTTIINKIDLSKLGEMELASTLEDLTLYSLDTLDATGNEQIDIDLNILQFKDSEILQTEKTLSSSTLLPLDSTYITSLTDELSAKADESFSKTNDGAITITNTADNTTSTITKVNTVPLTAKTYTIKEIAGILDMTLNAGWDSKLSLSITFNSDDMLYTTTMNSDDKISKLNYFNESAMTKIITTLTE